MLHCLSCSSDVADDCRFCPHCGTAIDKAARAMQASTLPAGSSVLTTSAASESDLKSSSGSIDHGRFVPGMVLDERYRIVGLLGTGGMGEVYRADDLKLGQTVALKFLPAALANDENRLQRFRNEVRIARQVAHPNVCRVYDLGEVDGHTYLTMEYIDGEDLASLLRRIGRLPRDKAIELGRQICAGLGATHQVGVLHRDLKPMNIMVDGRGKARLTDFGLAALAVELVGTSSRAGTPVYMSPEQLAGKAFTARSDVYSLGLVLYEMFTGKRAFEARTMAELTRQHREVSPTSPSTLVEDFDPAVERVILHCLSKNPEDRPPTPLAVAAGLPGGDPLTAALEAGETPSPELVAAAQKVDRVRPSVSLACVATILLGVFAFPMLNDEIQMHAFVPLEKPPQVLTDRAQSMIASLGYDPASDYAYGFSLNEDVLTQHEAYERSPRRWAIMREKRIPAIEFWYRQSDDYLVARRMSGVVTYDDPPAHEPGMVNVRLDPSGTLLELNAFPQDNKDFPHNPAPADWTQLFAFAGLDPTNFTSTEPENVPPVYCDQRRAWRGRLKGTRSTLVRVEAGAHLGQPVYFRVSEGWPAQDLAASARVEAATHASQVLSVMLFASALAGAVFLAKRNMNLGRGDRRGAFRVSMFVLTTMTLTWVLGADHVPTIGDEFGLFMMAAGQATLAAAICWLFYMALEPLARRRWPDMLISWSRFLTGRFTDPLIGRDILVGGLFGICGVLLLGAQYFGQSWFDAPPPRPLTVPFETFLGMRYDAVLLLRIMTASVLQPMVLVVILLLLLATLRYRSAAVSAFFLLLVGMGVLGDAQRGGDILVSLAYYGIMTAGLVFVLLRFGLLALMFALFFVLLLTSYPITYNSSAWYLDSSLFALVVASGLALYGGYISLGGRPLLQPELVPR